METRGFIMMKNYYKVFWHIESEEYRFLKEIFYYAI